VETRVIPEEEGSGEMQGASHMLLEEPLRLASVLAPAKPVTSPPPFLSRESRRRSAPCVVWFDRAWVSECGVTGNGVGSDQGFATG
jgi:hypothetical protein